MSSKTTLILLSLCILWVVIFRNETNLFTSKKGFHFSSEQLIPRSSILNPKPLRVFFQKDRSEPQATYKMPIQWKQFHSLHQKALLSRNENKILNSIQTQASFMKELQRIFYNSKTSLYNSKNEEIRIEVIRDVEKIIQNSEPSIRRLWLSWIKNLVRDVPLVMTSDEKLNRSLVGDYVDLFKMLATFDATFEKYKADLSLNPQKKKILSYALLELHQQQEDLKTSVHL